MKNHKIWQHLESLALGKGFYIVLALCLTAVGVSGYYLFDTVTRPLQQPQSVSSDTPVTIPDDQSVITPEPEVPIRPVQQPVEVTLPDEETLQPEPEVPAAAPQPEPAAPTVFTWPVKGEIMRGFSLETLSPDPTMGDWRTHAGLDVGASLGQRVLCMTEGTVAEVWEDDKLGTCIRVEHGGNLTSVYANLSPEPTVKPGDHMEIGAILGAVGSTAAAESGMGPHLHLEVFRNGEAMDPTELLPES